MAGRYGVRDYEHLSLSRDRRDTRRVQKRDPRFRRLTIILGILAVLIALIAWDGSRGSGVERRGTIGDTRGQVLVRQPDSTQPAPATSGDAVHTQSVIQTGANSGCVIDFPEGTRVRLGAGTAVLANIIDFDTVSGARTRRLRVLGGQIWVRAAPYGVDDELTIETPVVSRLPASGDRVSVSVYGVGTQFPPGTTRMSCHSGATNADTTSGGVALAGGHEVTIVPLQTGAVLLPMSDAESRGWQSVPDVVAAAPGNLRATLTGIERAFVLRPLLTVGRAVGVISRETAEDRDAKAIELAQGCVRELRTALGRMDSPPMTINLQTLDGLGMNSGERAAVLNNVAGGRLESYQLLPDGPLLTFRARDRVRSPFYVRGRN